MVNREKPDQEPQIINEEIRQDISKSLRSALEMSRDISHGEWGEDPKSISITGQDKKTYKFYKDTGRENSEWVMEIMDEEGNYENTVNMVESADVEYLEKLFEQDIPDSLRSVLEESREVSYEDYGEKKVVSVKHGGKTYKFYRDNREHADWVMDISDEKDEWLGTTDVREKSDVEYLEKLFETPTKEERIQDIRDKM